MSTVSLKNLVKKYGAVEVVHSIDLDVKDREFVALVGPSGCGKSTTLRMIAGLEDITGGEIRIGERVVNHLPPRQRNISMVFQSYAIFPHMTVYDNIAFGMKMRKVDKAEIDRRVRESAEMLHIDQLVDRYPSKLSGGQRQRVAVARAIAMQAQVLLMDEPLSNLDALLRLEMRAELKQLLNELEVTTIYVTHDQIEALSMGDRIAVMKEGKIQQVDHPSVVYDKPANEFVAGFIGNPPMNFMSGTMRRENGQVVLCIGDFKVAPSAEMQPVLESYDDEEMLIGIRAENMETLKTPADDAVKVRVQVVEPLGSQNLLTVRVGRDLVKVATHPMFEVQPGDDVWLRFPADKIRWIEIDSGLVLYPDNEKD